MFNNYLKVAFRSILKNKAISAINIIGLAIGLACCILIFLWVSDEMSYDQFHFKSDDLYRVVMDINDQHEEYHIALTPAPLYQKLSDDIPGIEQVSRYWPQRTGLVVIDSDRIPENRLAAVDPEFLNMFAFPLSIGGHSKILENPGAVVITQQIRDKYFKDKDPIARTILIDGREYVVTAVLKKLPENTHFRFDYLVSIYSQHGIGNRTADNWGVCNLFTYIRLNGKDNYDKISNSIAGLRIKYLPSSDGILKLQPVSDIHLYHKYDYNSSSGSDIKLIYLFSILAITILIMAVFNFIGLSTTQFIHRYKEIGVRKIIGAGRIHLVIQFMLESTILVFISLALATILLEYVLPWFNNFTSKSLSLSQITDWNHITGLIGFGVVIGIVAGLYPAFYLSSLKPLKTIANQLDFSENRRLLQKALVVVQFTLSIIFMVALVTIHRQLEFMQSEDLGFVKDRLIYLPLRGDIINHQDSFKQALKNHGGIHGVTAGFLPIGFMPSTVRWDWQGKTKGDEIQMHAVFADYDYITTLGLRLLEGRDFSPEFPGDTERSYIINESAKRIMGFSNPLDKRIFYDGHGSNGLEGKIIGVVGDFHFNSFHNEIGPAVLMIRPSMNRHLCIKIDSVNVQATLKFIENTWYSYVTDRQFEYRYLSDTIEDLYKKEKLTVKIVGYVMILTLIIACLGILGLSSFMISRRTKEIGIRKVLGASVPGMVSLISKEYLLLVGLSNLFAWPLATYLMNRWLNEFAYRTDIGIATLFFIGFLTAFIALLTVGYKAIQIARANPVEALKYE